MSRTEFHTGRLYPVKIETSLEETCKSIANRHGIELGEDWQEDFRENFNEYEYKRKRVTEEYFIHGEKLYRVIDHVESEDADYFMKLSRNSDGSISFMGQFYNGGTCFSEMLEESLEELKPSYIDQLKAIVDEIIDKYNEQAPITVPAAATLIMKYHGRDVARELFSGLCEEYKNDVFKSSAYQATLQTVIK
ncbi:MAG: hypothetical protein ACOVOV_17700 [Dolichospermum sp.]